MVDVALPFSSAKANFPVKYFFVGSLQLFSSQFIVLAAFVTIFEPSKRHSDNELNQIVGLKCPWGIV